MSGIYETPDGQKVHGDGRTVGSPLDPTQPSQTPRTDAAQKYYFSLSGQMQTMCVHQEFARTLELELVAALERVKELESHKFYVYITQQRDTLAARIAELERDKERLVDSPTWQHVLKFALRMEAKLAKNRHKGDRKGWINDDPFALVDRITDERDELLIAMSSGTATADDIANEAADVGNFAMMVADWYSERAGLNKPSLNLPHLIACEEQVGELEDMCHKLAIDDLIRDRDQLRAELALANKCVEALRKCQWHLEASGIISTQAEIVESTKFIARRVLNEEVKPSLTALDEFKAKQSAAQPPQ